MGSKTTKTVHFLAFKAFFLVRSSATDKKKNAEGRKMGVFTSFSTSHRNKSTMCGGKTNGYRRILWGKCICSPNLSALQ